MYPSGHPIYPEWAIASTIVSTSTTVHTMSQAPTPSRNAAPRKRRSYSDQFKVELVAATARAHGISANMLYRWLREHRLGRHQSACDTVPAAACGVAAHGADAASTPTANAPVRAPAPQTAAELANPVPNPNPVPAFIALALGAPPVAPGPALAPQAPGAAALACPSDIRIECFHHGTRVTVHWPVTAAGQCCHALQGLLQGLRP